MKISMISKSDRHGGGASRIAQELSGLLRERGHTVVQYAVNWQPDSTGFRSVQGGKWTGRLIRKFNQLLRVFPGWQERFPLEYFTLKRAGVLEADIIHLHDLSHTLSPVTVSLLSKLKPTVWTFHDCAAFTGGCIFPVECEKFTSGCGKPCPRMDEWPLRTGRNKTSAMWHLKKKIAARNHFRVIAPSDWMKNQALRSGFFSREPARIDYGMDLNLFTPADKRKIRREMGWPVDRLIILLSAGRIDDPRKGIRYSLEVLRKVSHLNPLVVLVGQMDEATREKLNGLEILELGYVRSEKEKARVFAAASLFLFCPTDDNYPLTIMEAMACGTPMFGFATGGIPEMFPNKDAGYLVTTGDTNALAQALEEKVNGDGRELVRMGDRARAVAERKFTYERFAEEHLALYRGEIKWRGEN